MYRIHYAIAATVRFVLFYALRPIVKGRAYEHPEQVMDYRGWFELPVVGVLAFVRGDNSLQFYW